MSAPGIVKRPSRARLEVLAGLAVVAVLLLADAALAASAHVSAARNAGASAAPTNAGVRTLARRCDPPPCPARLVSGVRR